MAPAPSSTERPTASRSVLPVLLVILVFGAALRLLYFWAPFVDGHSFRQVDTAAIARNFYETSFIPFDPQIDWGGRRGYVEAEFPAIPAAVAVLYRAFGFHEWFGRVVVLPFSLGLIWAAYRLTIALGARPAAGLAAAFFVAASPVAAFFGRVLMPDTPMLFLATLALIGFVEFGRTGANRWLWLGSVSLGLACLIKLPGIFVGPAIAVALLRARGWSVLRDRRVWLAAIIPLAVTAAWYFHARQIFEQTGLTFGVSGGTSKMYPPSISPGPWPSTFSKWSSLELLGDVDFYDRLIRRFYHLIWSPAGFVLALIGAALVERRGAIEAWLASMAIFVLVAGDAHLAHEYYQLPFVVIGAVWFGAAAWPAFDPDWIRAHVGRRSAHIAAFGVVVLLAAVTSFYQSGIVQSFYEPHGMAARVRESGIRMDEVTPDNSLAIVLDNYGITSPMLLYFAHLKGWSFDLAQLTPELIEHLRDMGARYFATTRMDAVQERRPEVAAYLRNFQPVPFPGSSNAVQLIDLHQRRALP